MRLIDADAFKDWLLNHFANPQDTLVLTLQGFIAEQKTAYDIDNVVESLESYRNEITCDIDIDNAIEIVKQGCISDDVCEWKYSGNVFISCNYKRFTDLHSFEYCPYYGKKIKVVE